MLMCQVFGHRFRAELITPGSAVMTNIKLDDFRVERLAGAMKAHTVQEACTRCRHVASSRTRPSEPRQAVSERVDVPTVQTVPVRPAAANADGVFDGVWPTEGALYGVEVRLSCTWYEKDPRYAFTYDPTKRDYQPARRPCPGHLVKTYPSGNHVCSNGDNHWWGDHAS